MSCFREYGEITVDEVSCYFRCISQQALRERETFLEAAQDI